MTSPLKVLMLEDQLPKAEHLQQLLRNKRPNWQLSLVANRETFLQALEQFKPDVIVADHTMESFSALEALELSKNRKEQTAFIMITDALSEDVHELINHGANDFVLRDTPARLPAAIESALRHSNAEKERLAAIEKLNLNEENYRKLVQRISDGFMAVDVNWRFTYLNKKAEELFGKSADYLVGKNLWAEYPQQIYRNFYRAFHRAMTTQEIGHIADFSTLFNRWIEATIYPSLSGLSIFFRDISEERKKEEKIKESEEKYRTLFELALDGIFLADYNGNILDVNSSLCAIFGQPRDKIVGTNLFAGFLRDEAARLEKPHPGEEVPRLIEKTLVKGDGTIVYVETSSRRLPNGQIQGIVRDISERKQKEIELQESEEKYRNLIDRTTDGVMIYSMTGQILDLNHNSSQFLGYSRDELLNMSITDLFYPEELVKRPLAFDRLQAGFAVIDYRRLRRKDGSSVELEISTTMLPDGNLMAFGRDVSERRILQKEQQRNLEELAAVYKLNFALSRANSVEAIFDEAMNTLQETIHSDRCAILLYDPDGVVRFKAWHNLSQEYRQAVEGHSPWTRETRNAEPVFVADTEVDDNVARWRPHFRSEGIRALGFIPIMQNGHLLGKFMLYSDQPREFTGRESRLAQNIASHVGFAIERQKAEDELRLKENAISSSISGMGMTDLSGKIIYANDALARMWGFADKKQLLGRSLPEFFDGDRVYQTIQALQTRGYDNGEDMAKREDGSLFPVAFSATVISNDKGEPVCMFGSFIDISERKKAEERIINEKQLSDSIINSLPGVFYLYDEDGSFLRWNRNFELVTEYTGEEIRKMHPLDFYDISFQPIIQKRIRDVFAGDVSGIEVIITTRTGHKIPLFCHSVAINYEGKKCLLGMGIDISARKQAEEKIRIFNDRFQTLSRATNDAVWDWNLVTNEVWWNESFFNVLGFDPRSSVPVLEEWTRKGHPDERETIVNKLKALKRGEINSWEGEYRFQLPDGSWGTALNRAYLLKDAEGNPTRIVGALMDITERKRLVRELEVLSLIAKETGNGVLIFDRESGKTTWVNEGFTRLTGYSLRDIYGKTPAELLYGPETDLKTMAYLQEQKRKGLPYAADVLIYTRTGEKKWHYINGQPMRDENGELTKYFVLSTDVSDRLRLEDERLNFKINQQKEISRAIIHGQESERNELGRELHDNINQILSAVNIKLEFSLEHYDNSRQIVQDCRSNLQDAIHEIRQLSHRMVTPRFSEISMQDILFNLVAKYAGRLDIRLDTSEMNEDLIPNDVKATLFRIMQEQLTNVQKHAHASQVLIRIHNEPDLVSLRISDNGVGFDMSIAHDGIGILNMKNRVDVYNGSVEIVSAPGDGCTLQVTVPLNKQH